ncbi:Aminoglycoside 3-N-acetyltransferase [Cyclobacterium lianum]|uniref:Aminoglycoside N(3)-acetyltransferase n=1 Tax=Cyclobacterium lianum TaxID=388280 RepID=A0A1M7NGW6_9BACT|nr:AAC(3) family N-acetyltransferase [Cyclobacterium lianum]SHN02914.1 Aminoglycoside 3-N-acetyltransferase [Cyclobacterium lianum]
MIDRIVKYIKYWTPVEMKNFYRKVKRRYERQVKLSGEDRLPLSLASFEKILRENLNIVEGDTLIIHSSFGNMNADFSPEEAITLLKTIVGESGNLLMPFYPTGHAYYWIQEGGVFDVYTSRSFMGILTQKFKESNGVKLSPHPAKALSAWGKDRDWLIGEHHMSRYPYDKYSPYFKTKSLPNSKTVGLGVEINSFFHACEDLFLQEKSEIYSEQLFEGKMNYYGEMQTVRTYLHQPEKVNSIISPCNFLKQTDCPDYRLVLVKGVPYYSVRNESVYLHAKKLLEQGISRTTFSKKSTN